MPTQVVKLIDDVIVPCSDNYRHHQITKWLRSLPSKAYITDQRAVVITENGVDPCRSTISVWRSEPNQLPSGVTLKNLGLGLAACGTAIRR